MSEKTESKRLGARQHKNSGRGLRKGDASWYDYVIDFKEVSKSFKIDTKTWAKVCTDAMQVDIRKHPMLAVVLGVENKVRLAIVELDLLQHREEFYQRWKHLEE